MATNIKKHILEYHKWVVYGAIHRTPSQSILSFILLVYFKSNIESKNYTCDCTLTAICLNCKLHANVLMSSGRFQVRFYLGQIHWSYRNIFFT